MKIILIILIYIVAFILAHLLAKLIIGSNKNMKKKFVLSSSSFENKADAEKKVQRWKDEGTLQNGTKLYKVVEVYDLQLKFVKRKE